MALSERFQKKIQEAREKQLESLNLSNDYLTADEDKLTEIPEEVFELKHLKVLTLSNNKILTISEYLGNLTNLITLNLGDNQLATLPENLDNLTSLTALYLEENQLTTLPENLGNLTNLTALYLGRNKLTTLPENLGNLTNLTALYLEWNKLNTFPELIGNLTNLTTLYLEGNQLSAIPKFIGHLTNLTTLYLEGNQLSAIPKFIGHLTNLTTLYLERNKLNTLPENLGNLTNLTTLNLKINKLTTLPEFIISLTNLTTLYLDENPLINPPIEIADKGIEAVREYFRQLKEVGTDHIYEAKLLIVGEAGAGKTTLAKKIENPDYKLKKTEPSTEGIDIIKYSFPLENGYKFQINIWDFGGQEIYHATHRFFLTKRSLYSLVVDNRREDDNLYYWLNIVELLSNNSPLLILKNEKQNRKRDINELILRGQFKNLKETLATNLNTNQGLDKILAQIKYYIRNLDHIGTELPTTWVKVRQTLEQDERNYISFVEYLKICEANGIKRDDDQLQLSGYLHDLGICLHFQDDKKSILYKTVILKPEWGTDAVYRVLDNPKVEEQYGCFNEDDLKDIWHEEQYNDMHGELLQLMMKFELCYEIPGSKDTFISPQLLSNNQPEYDWDKSNNLILRYTYSDFMPKGIISRFIVVMHQYIDQQKYVWKSGVILKQDNTKAEVIEDFGKREIRIHVAGNNKRGLLTVVCHELDKINNSYKRLKYQKLIPCNCETCKDIQNPYAYKFQELVERLDYGKLTIECGKRPFHDVQILSLIENAIDIKQLVSQDKQDRNKSFHFEDIQQLIFQLSEKGDISGDFMSGRNTKIEKGNYNERIERDYVDKSTTQNISGTVANTINQLPSFENEPEKKELKELLDQLQTAVKETELDEEEKEESLEQIQAIAQCLAKSEIADALTNSQDGVVPFRCPRYPNMTTNCRPN